MGEVGGGDLGRSRQGEVAAGLGPGLEGAPGGGVHLPGVFGDAAVQGVLESLDVGAGEGVGGGGRHGLGGRVADGEQGVFEGHNWTP